MPGDGPAGPHGNPSDRRPHRELLTIVLEPSGEIVEASLRGELDESTAPKLVDRIEAAVEPGQDLVIDASGLTFCGSAGLSALILIERQVSGAGGSLAIDRPTPFLVQLLEMAGLDGLITSRPGG